MAGFASGHEHGYAGHTCVLGGFHHWGEDFGVILQGRRGCVRLRCERCGAFARHAAPDHIGAR